MIDKFIIEQIIDAMRVNYNDNILEIGPGQGALTIPLLNKLKQLSVVEIDNNLVKWWRLKNIDNLIIHHNDILSFDLLKVGNHLTIIGNLPYNISTPILFKMIDNIKHIKYLCFMLQYEVAERIIANSGSKKYGRLSVMLQAFFAIEMLFNIPKSAFYPRPKVDSTIIKLTPKKQNIQNIDNFSFIVKHAFKMKRKTIKNNLKNILLVNNMGIDDSKRAENLTVDEFIILSNEYTRNIFNR